VVQLDKASAACAEANVTRPESESTTRPYVYHPSDSSPHLTHLLLYIPGLRPNPWVERRGRMRRQQRTWFQRGG
jgi:hypothetical protein